MESSRFSYLPEELLKETLTYSSLEDIKTFFEAYQIEFTPKLLNWLAKEFKLPNAYNIDILIAHSNYGIQKHIHYCIEYNDTEALERLLPIYDKPIDEDIIIDSVEYTNFHEVYRLILSHELRVKAKLTDNHLIMAIRSKDKDLIDLIIDTATYLSLIHEVLIQVIKYVDIDMLEFLSTYVEEDYWTNILYAIFDQASVRTDILKYIIDNKSLDKNEYEDALSGDMTPELIDILYPVIPQEVIVRIIRTYQTDSLKYLVNKVGKEELESYLLEEPYDKYQEKLIELLEDIV